MRFFFFFFSGQTRQGTRYIPKCNSPCWLGILPGLLPAPIRSLGTCPHPGPPGGARRFWAGYPGSALRAGAGRAASRGPARPLALGGRRAEPGAVPRGSHRGVEQPWPRDLRGNRPRRGSGAVRPHSRRIAGLGVWMCPAPERCRGRLNTQVSAPPCHLAQRTAP